MTKKSKASVFAVPSYETGDGRYHEVLWAKDGNLNASHRRGDEKRFMANRAGWERAKSFARAKAKSLGVKATIHPY